jgi:hypothetical protein
MSTNNDRIIALESRIAVLESIPQCNCTECQASRRDRIAEQAIFRQLAVERAPDAIAQVRKMSPSDQAMFWQRATPERAIELLISPEITDDERTRWTPVRLRDRVELELIELPDRVRVRLVAENMRCTPLHIVVDDDNARKLQAVGLGARLVRVHGDVTEFVPMQITKDFPSPVVERRQLDAMLKVDTRLRDCIVAGEMVVEQLSAQENKLVEAQLWRDLDWQSRPKRPRKKAACFKLDADTGRPQ